MKIISDDNINIRTKTLSYASNHYLIVSSIVYIDTPTQKILPAIDMLEQTQQFIRHDQILDEGYAKSNAEILIYANAHSKEDTTVKEIGFKLYNKNQTIKKELIAIGNRVLKRNFFGSISISKPKPFKKLKIGYETAYGGEKFKNNPIGKGYKKNLKSNEELILHNIDIKNNPIITNKKSNATPQSFEPISLSWNQRIKKLGTFNQRWLKSYWPYYPKDINFEVFNTAPKDQQIEGFFIGDEKFELYNMNKDDALLQGELPNKKVQTILSKTVNNEEVYIKLKNKIDTIILFPEIKKAAIISRSMIKIDDDETGVYESVFSLIENQDEKEHDINYYIPIRAQYLNDIKEDEKEDKNSQDVGIEDINLMFEMNFRKGLGQTPHIVPSSSTLKQMQQKDAAYIDELLNKKNISQKEISNLNELKKLTSYETFTNIIPDEISKLKEKNKDKIDAKLKQSQDKYPSQNIQNMLDNNIDEITNHEQMKKIEQGYETVLIQNWQDGAKFFLGDTNYILTQSNDKYKELKKLGLKNSTINHILYIGYNDEEKIIKANQWIDNKEDIKIPIGYIIGYFDKNIVKKLIVRQNIFDKNDKYLKDSKDIVVKGSQDIELILKGTKKEYIIIVDDILEAYLLFQNFWQLCSIVLFKTKDQFEKSDYFKENKDLLKVIYTTKFDLKYENIKTYNLNINNIYKEYILDKKDIEYEIIEQLPPSKDKSIAKRELKKKKKQGNNYIGYIDPKSYDKRVNDKLNNSINDNILNEKLLSNFDEKEKTQFLDYINDLKTGTTKNQQNIDDTLNNIMKTIDNKIEQNPQEEFKSKMQSLKSNLNNIIEKSKLKNQKSPMKESTKKSFKKYFDEDLDKQSIDFNTKEELISYYKTSLDFSNANINIDELKNHTFENCNFKKTTWNNTILSNITFLNCNFEKSSFNNTILEKCNITKSNMKNIKIDNNEISNSKILDTNLSNSTILSTNIENTLLKKSNLKSVVIKNCEIIDNEFLSSLLSESMIIENKLQKNNFLQCIIENVMHTKNSISKSKYNKSSLNKSSFMDTTISNSDFSNSLLENILVSKDVVIKDIDFSNSSFNNSYFQNTLIENVNFQAASFNKSLLEKCIIKSSNMTNIDAKQSNFSKSEFYSCNMQYMNLFKGNLEKSELIQCNLNNSNLYGCTIFNTKIKNTPLKNCNLDDTNLEGGKQRYIENE